MSKEKIKIEDTNGTKADRAPDILPDFSFTYSGYLEMVGVRIAIINGMEYETGDEIVGGPYVLRGIYPNRVVIGIKGVDGEKGKITVPIEEEIL